MQGDRIGQIAVIFLSQRTDADADGYAAAAAAMDERASRQPGYRGMHSVRNADGFGITVSWWADEPAAIAWRDQVDHAGIRAEGRRRWYASYEVAVATVTRSYAWARPDGATPLPSDPAASADPAR